MSPALAGGFFTTSVTWEAQFCTTDGAKSQHSIISISFEQRWKQDRKQKFSEKNVWRTGFDSRLGRSLEKEMATHSSILAWRIPRTEEFDRLESMGLQKSDMS